MQFYNFTIKVNKTNLFIIFLLFTASHKCASDATNDNKCLIVTTASMYDCKLCSSSTTCLQCWNTYLDSNSLGCATTCLAEDPCILYIILKLIFYLKYL